MVHSRSSLPYDRRRGKKTRQVKGSLLPVFPGTCLRQVHPFSPTGRWSSVIPMKLPPADTLRGVPPDTYNRESTAALAERTGRSSPANEDHPTWLKNTTTSWNPMAPFPLKSNAETGSLSLIHSTCWKNRTTSPKPVLPFPFISSYNPS